MKKFTSLLLLIFCSFTLTYGQNQNKSNAVSYYNSAEFINQGLPALSSSGGSALVFIDFTYVDDKVVSTLISKGFSVVMATDGSDFNTKITATNYDLVVLFLQNNNIFYNGINLTAVHNYILGGGKMMFADWGTAFTDDQTCASYFEASFTGVNNQNTVTLLSPGTGGLTSFTVSNPSTYPGFTYSTGLTAIGTGEVLATFPNGNAAIVRGNGGRTLMLGYLSDAPSAAVREDLFNNNLDELGAATVPVPLAWIIAAFLLIIASTIFAKRKVLFS